MADSNWFFLYTPLPYLLAMYLAAYRHDLTRMMRPVRDRAGRKEWLSVCNYLRLVLAESRKRPWRSPSFMAALASSLISFSWIVVPARPEWYFLCSLQMVAALPLLLLLVRMIGPIPFRPYTDVLPFPRLGTRIRHLKELEGTGTSP